MRRAQKFFDETGDTLLKPYESWADFALNLKNPASIINFIAAYGTHRDNHEPQTTVDGQSAAAATLLVLGGDGRAGRPPRLPQRAPAPMPAARSAA